jgi:hypothetical protein
MEDDIPFQGTATVIRDDFVSSLCTPLPQEFLKLPVSAYQIISPFNYVSVLLSMLQSRMLRRMCLSHDIICSRIHLVQ